jgi:hypothetical protein
MDLPEGQEIDLEAEEEEFKVKEQSISSSAAGWPNCPRQMETCRQLIHICRYPLRSPRVS